MQAAITRAGIERDVRKLVLLDQINDDVGLPALRGFLDFSVAHIIFSSFHKGCLTIIKQCDCCSMYSYHGGQIPLGHTPLDIWDWLNSSSPLGVAGFPDC